jgi:hypothetical protein
MYSFVISMASIAFTLFMSGDTSLFIGNVLFKLD